MNFFINKKHTKLLVFVWRFIGFPDMDLVRLFTRMMLEAKWRNIAVERERKFSVQYKGDVLPHYFFADFVIFGDIIVGVKAFIPDIDSDCISQTLNYLKAPGCGVGLIINFGKKSLEYKRLIF